MPSESVIVEVRADEVRAGDELNTSAPWSSWLRVERVEHIVSRASGEVVRVRCEGTDENGDSGWETIRLDDRVIVRRPAPAPSGAEEGDALRVFFAECKITPHASREGWWSVNDGTTLGTTMQALVWLAYRPDLLPTAPSEED